MSRIAVTLKNYFYVSFGSIGWWWFSTATLIFSELTDFFGHLKEWHS